MLIETLLPNRAQHRRTGMSDQAAAILGEITALLARGGGPRKAHPFDRKGAASASATYTIATAYVTPANSGLGPDEFSGLT